MRIRLAAPEVFRPIRILFLPLAAWGEGFVARRSGGIRACWRILCLIIGK
jgi:hypothetical protein